MRTLYVYDPLTRSIVEKTDVSELTDEQVEMSKISLILSTGFPLEVLDSAVDSLPIEAD